ncbi:MAG: tetratricopeptide repeat protein [Pseudomonadota bacterium]
MDPKRTADALVAEGLELYRTGQLDQAIEKWKSALLLDPGSHSASEYIKYVSKNRKALDQRFGVGCGKQGGRSNKSAVAIGDKTDPNVSRGNKIQKGPVFQEVDVSAAFQAVEGLGLDITFNDIVPSPLDIGDYSVDVDFENDEPTASVIQIPGKENANAANAEGRIPVSKEIRLEGEIKFQDTGRHLLLDRPLDEGRLPTIDGISPEQGILADTAQHLFETDDQQGAAKKDELPKEGRYDVPSLDSLGGDMDFAEEQLTPSLGEEQINEMLVGAKRMFDEGNHDASYWFCERVLVLQPSNSEAKSLLKKNRVQLEGQYEQRLGDFGQIPIVRVPQHEITWHRLDHRAGFLLSRIDGRLSYAELMDISGMDHFETMRVLVQLMEDGVIGVGK